MRNDQKASAGDVALYKQLKNGTVTAVNGNSNAGKGWRPTCKGAYLGREVYSTEKAAVIAGREFLVQLEARVKSMQRAIRPKIEKLKRAKEKDND